MKIDKNKKTLFILDVDGVMTSGVFYYTSKGKFMKAFGPDDHDALCLLKPYLEIRFVTGDSKGFSISKKRIQKDMGFPLDLVSTIKRIEWINKKFPKKNIIYMGDGIFDHYVMKKVNYSIAPNNADENAKKFANYVTKRNGGDRAVAEASLHILKKFFKRFNPDKMPEKNVKLSGKWNV